MKIIKSFRNAIQGIYYIWVSELHYRLHFIFALAVGFAGYLTGLTLEKNDHIRIAKDMAAGAVLLVSLGSLLCGLIIFIPKWL